ncbi:MAG: hypothetical protein M0T81_03530 [Thermoplasmatales archaeon]|jgi:hypothetical protein|nr:hypothetical protein [Thermoplasmatales archaeon]
MSYGMDRALAMVQDFLTNFFGILESYISNETSFLESLFLQFFSSLSSSYRSYGIFIPVILVSSIGMTIMGMYLVFLFFSPLNVVAGDV